MTYEILKDNVYKCFVVWEVHRNYKVEMFRGLKRECKQWISNIK